TVSEYSFVTQSRDRIVVSARGAAILSIVHTPRLGGTYSCTQSTCAGATLGAAGGDGNRPLEFDSTVLEGSAGGSETLDGNLIAGTTFPALICSGETYYFRLAGDYAGGDCVAGPSEITSFQRAIYTFPGASGAAGSLEVRLDGDSVASILHYG